MGRAAGGDRLLSAALRLSRLLQAACRAEPARADRLDARQDLRQEAVAARPIRVEAFRNVVQATGGAARCLQLRGEYHVRRRRARAASAPMTSPSIANKGVSEKIITAPFSPLGQDTHVADEERHLHGAADQPADRARCATRRRCATMNQEQAFHPIYHYAVDHRRRGRPDPGQRRHPGRRRAAQQLPEARADLEPGRRAERRAAHHAGRPLRLYRRRRRAGGGRSRRSAEAAARRDACRCRDARASALQFRYLWVTDAAGWKWSTSPGSTSRVPVAGATVPLADARRVYVARTYAYVAAKQDGLVIVDVHQAGAAAASISKVDFRRAAERRRGRDRRLDQRLAVRLCRRRPERPEGDPAHHARRASPISTASRPRPSPS